MSEEMSREKLVALIRRIAREEAYVALDEHITDFEHKERPPEDLIEYDE